MGRFLHSTQAVFEFSFCKDICVFTTRALSHRSQIEIFVASYCFWNGTGGVVSSASWKDLTSCNRKISHLQVTGQSTTSWKKHPVDLTHLFRRIIPRSSPYFYRNNSILTFNAFHVTEDRLQDSFTYFHIAWRYSGLKPMKTIPKLCRSGSWQDVVYAVGRLKHGSLFR